MASYHHFRSAVFASDDRLPFRQGIDNLPKCRRGMHTVSHTIMPRWGERLDTLAAG
jgi:hypothetical protein